MGKPENNLQTKCIKYLKAHKIYHINIYGSGFSGKGAPDLMCCVNGVFVAFELKVDNNDMQDDQVIHKIRIKRNKGLHFKPYTFEEFVSIVETIKAKYRVVKE